MIEIASEAFGPMKRRQSSGSGMTLSDIAFLPFAVSSLLVAWLSLLKVMLGLGSLLLATSPDHSYCFVHLKPLV